MYNNPYFNTQNNLDRINAQINELEKMKTQIQQPTPITQNFQIAPTNRETIKYANSMDEVKRDMVIGDTPYFSKDMSVVWIKNTKGEIKTYELTEIIEKDEKDMKIELLQARISELERKVINEPSNEYDDESIKDEKPTNVQEIRANKKK
jgi:hypothetical protein